MEKIINTSGESNDRLPSRAESEVALAEGVMGLTVERAQEPVVYDYVPPTDAGLDPVDFDGNIIPAPVNRATARSQRGW